MRRFEDILTVINERLDIPQPAKSRIVLEIASDMEGAYYHYMDQGMEEEEAVRKAREMFAVDDTALQQLVRIHQAPIRRWLDSLSNQAQLRWERFLLLAVLLTVMAVSVPVITTTAFLQETSGYVWPVLVMGLAGLIIGIDKAISLFIFKDHRMERLRSKLIWLPLLAGVSLFTGILGYFLEMAQSEHMKILTDYKMLIVFEAKEPEMTSTLIEVTTWLIRSSSMIVTSMFVAMCLSILWFFLENKVKRIELTEATSLLMGNSDADEISEQLNRRT